MPALQINHQMGRFISVGIINTLLDFGILFLLKTAGLPTIPANVTSTSIAFIFSFFANKKYTFKSSGTNIAREITLFIVVTLIGLWVFQTIIIALLSPLFTSLLHNESISLLISKLFATGVSMTWNYVMYQRFVFVHAKK